MVNRNLQRRPDCRLTEGVPQFCVGSCSSAHFMYSSVGRAALFWWPWADADLGVRRDCVCWGLGGNLYAITLQCNLLLITVLIGCPNLVTTWSVLYDFKTTWRVMSYFSRISISPSRHPIVDQIFGGSLYLLSGWLTHQEWATICDAPRSIYIFASNDAMLISL